MAVNFPVLTSIDVQGYQMYPGTDARPGISHAFIPGLHLIAGVNGLGKSTLLLMIYHGIVGPASLRSDDLSVAMPDVIKTRHADRFRRRVSDGARDAELSVEFEIGAQSFSVRRSLHDLSLRSWQLNGAEQALDDAIYDGAVKDAMNVGSFADVLIILNAIVFMFETRSLLMWTPAAQRNVLRALFMAPDAANLLAARARNVAKANSAYRNLLYIVNRERRQLAKAKAALVSADAVTVEYTTLLSAIAADVELLQSLQDSRLEADERRTDARTTGESAKLQYDASLREVEALKLTAIAKAFPDADEAGHYILARLLGDKRCLTCGSDGGELIERWSAAVKDGACVICGAPPEEHEVLVPEAHVDVARLDRASARLANSEEAFCSASEELAEALRVYAEIQARIDQVNAGKTAREKRVRELVGFLPPSPPEVAKLEEQLKNNESTLANLHREQRAAEEEFSVVFDGFRQTVEERAAQVRASFAAKISEFLVERAEISLGSMRSAIGESGQTYDWPTFRISMTSGTFDAPTPRWSAAEVSLSQGEFIDLAFRLALATAAADGGPATLIFDAPEASLDALFMRRAGAFLAKFTRDNLQNRLVVTSNLTNADMIPALFGAYEPLPGDPQPIVIPRPERSLRVIDLLALAAPTSAVKLVGDRYAELLDRALFPPDGSAEPGL
jgi:hypothetical protein